MTEQAARGLKIKVQVLEVRRREDLPGAFLAAKAIPSLSLPQRSLALSPGYMTRSRWRGRANRPRQCSGFGVEAAAQWVLMASLTPSLRLDHKVGCWNGYAPFQTVRGKFKGDLRI
jgi:hypothetical protein